MMGRQAQARSFYFFCLTAVCAVKNLIAAGETGHAAGQQQQQLELALTTLGNEQPPLRGHPADLTNGRFASLHAVLVTAVVVSILTGVWCWRRRRTKGLQYSAVDSASSASGDGEGDDPESVWKQATTPEGKKYWFHTETDEVRWSEPPPG